jgi:hypothetical protein
MATTSEINIKKFDPAKMLPPDAVILVLGKRASGKSALIVDLMYNMRHKLDLCLGFNTTEESSRTLHKITHPSLIFYDYDNPRLRRILDYQRDLVKMSEAPGTPPRWKRIGLVLDDCGDDKKIFKYKEIVEIHKMGRHRKLFFINATQYAIDMPAQLRGQVDFVFAFSHINSNEREKLWRYYFGVFNNMKEFDSVFLECTKGFDCMVLDARKKSYDPSECCYWYRANLGVPEFTVGRTVYKRLHEYYYDEVRAEKGIDLERIADGAPTDDESDKKPASVKKCIRMDTDSS